MSLLSHRPCRYPWPAALHNKAEHKQPAHVQCQALEQQHASFLWTLYPLCFLFTLPWKGEVNYKWSDECRECDQFNSINPQVIYTFI